MPALRPPLRRELSGGRDLDGEMRRELSGGRDLDGEIDGPETGSRGRSQSQPSVRRPSPSMRAPPAGVAEAAWRRQAEAEWAAEVVRVRVRVGVGVVVRVRVSRTAG